MIKTTDGLVIRNETLRLVMLTVTDGIDQWGLYDPERNALVKGRKSLSYRELKDRTDAIAVGLRHLCKDDKRPVAILVKDPIAFALAFLGVAKAGVLAMPLNPSWNRSDAELVLRECQVARVITEDVADILPMQTTLAELEGFNPETIGFSTPRPVDLDTAFYIGFTSGSTGVPRALVRDHRAWVSSFMAMAIEFGSEPGERRLIPGSLFFSLSLIAMLQSLYTSGTVVFPSPQVMTGSVVALREGVDSLHTLPSALAQIIRLAKGRQETFPSMKRIVCGGEHMWPELRDDVRNVFPKTNLYEYYGASEFGFATIFEPGKESAKSGCVGRPFWGSKITIRDPEKKPMEVEKIGLLHVQNSYGPIGLYTNGQLVPYAPHRWRTAGDLAYYGADGRIYLAGRLDNMAVIKGENIYPEEIEEAIRANFSIGQIAVLPMPPQAPRYLVVAVEKDEGVPRDSIVEHCRSRFSALKIPRDVIVVDSFPLTATGKVDRIRLAHSLRSQQRCSTLE